MFSRAHLLIEREYERLQDVDLWGISAHPITDDNIFEWTAKVYGLKGTIWEGGVFRLYIKFDENYNFKPPEVCFHTIPFHPNVDMITGKPCVEYLDDWNQWQESTSITYILLSIQAMLSNPALDNAINLEAVDMIKRSPFLYKQVVQECVVASQRVEAGLDPHVQDSKVCFVMPKDEEIEKQTPKTAPARVAKVSFDEYHTTWTGIATSKANPEMVNPLLEAIKQNSDQQAVHVGLPMEEIKAQMQKQMRDHSLLMYGRFKMKSSEEDARRNKLEAVNKMRKVYLHPRSQPPTDRTHGKQKEEREPWENDVDDLVAWTTKLDEDAI